MMFNIPRADTRRINTFDNVLFTVSGGMDSTFTAIQFLEHRIYMKKPRFILIHNNTRMRLRQAKKTLEKLKEDFREDRCEWLQEDPQLDSVTKHLLHDTNEVQVPTLENQISENQAFWVEIFPEVFNSRQTILESFQFMPKAKKLLEEGNFSKKVFPCCWHLKEKPFEKWLKTQKGTNNLVILSIGPSDSTVRRKWLIKLRRERTKFWFNKRRQVWYYYPLRDTLAREVEEYLRKHPRYYDTQHSGCQICPILVALNMQRKDPIRFKVSRRAYLKILCEGVG